MSELFIPSEGSDAAKAESADLVEQILEQLEPMIARQRRAIAKHGCLRAISSTHLHVLYLLENGAMTMSRLAEQLDVSLPNVTGIVDRMEERGFVERGRDPEDRRVVTVRATAGGHETVEEIDQIRRHSMRTILARMTPAQQARALLTFTDMRAAAEEAGDVEVHSHKHLSATTPNN